MCWRMAHDFIHCRSQRAFSSRHQCAARLGGALGRRLPLPNSWFHFRLCGRRHIFRYLATDSGGAAAQSFYPNSGGASISVYRETGNFVSQLRDFINGLTVILRRRTPVPARCNPRDCLHSASAFCHFAAKVNNVLLSGDAVDVFTHSDPRWEVLSQ
jgi:hypothetical protein